MKTTHVRLYKSPRVAHVQKTMKSDRLVMVSFDTMTTESTGGGPPPARKYSIQIILYMLSLRLSSDDVMPV